MPLQMIASFAMSGDQNLPGALVKRSTGFNLNMKRIELSYYNRLNALCQVETRFVSDLHKIKRNLLVKGVLGLFSMPSPVLLSSGSMLYCSPD